MNYNEYVQKAFEPCSLRFPYVVPFILQISSVLDGKAVPGHLDTGEEGAPVVRMKGACLGAEVTWTHTPDGAPFLYNEVMNGASEYPEVAVAEPPNV